MSIVRLITSGLYTRAIEYARADARPHAARLHLDASALRFAALKLERTNETVGSAIVLLRQLAEELDEEAES